MTSFRLNGRDVEARSDHQHLLAVETQLLRVGVALGAQLGDRVTVDLDASLGDEGLALTAGAGARGGDAGATGLVLLLFGELVGKDRNEDNIVDTEHDFESQECEQCAPGGGVREPFHAEEC